MKLLALICGTFFIGLSAQTYLIDEVSATPSHYAQSIAVEKDYVGIVYLPNNTCHIEQPGITPMDVKDYVRACMNNRHLHTRMHP